MALIVSITLACMYMQWRGTATPLTENRTLASFPQAPANRDDWLGYPTAFDAYMDDNFGLRLVLLRLYNRLHVALGVSPSERVILGEEGWLFYEVAQLTDQNRGALPLNEEQLDNLQHRF